MAAYIKLRPGMTVDESLRQDREIYEKWSAVTIEAPISEEIKPEVKADLMESWHFKREAIARQDLSAAWSGTSDFYRVVLNDCLGKVGFQYMLYCCNQPAAFYWLQPAQTQTCYGETSVTSRPIFAAMYEEWRRCYPDNRPDFEFGHFFANPVRVTASGPTTVPEIIDAHKSLCTQASTLLSNVKDRPEEYREFCNAHRGAEYPSDLQNHALNPLYYSIILMIDNLDSLNDDYDREIDGYLSLPKIAQYQTVLIVRTGNEQGLSAPISFESLETQLRPLKRNDIAGEGTEVIRVSLVVAIQFITSLERREESANSAARKRNRVDARYYPIPSEDLGENEEIIQYDPELWADANFVRAKKHGIRKYSAMETSVLRVLSRRAGEDFLGFEHVPLNHRWV
ncbi:MAG: hypothetical protein Q9170_006685 [Blastenia crenularia]